MIMQRASAKQGLLMHQHRCFGASVHRLTMARFLAHMEKALVLRRRSRGLPLDQACILVCDNAPSHNGDSLFEEVKVEGKRQWKCLFWSVDHPGIYMVTTLPGRSHAQNSGASHVFFDLPCTLSLLQVTSLSTLASAVR